MNTVAHLNTALAGRYEIIREAGAGGMATVFLARDVRHDRQVAIKVLREDLAASLGAERFLREVRIAAQLQHPHILPVFDSGDADGTLWYAMPFVAGETLREKLARDGALPIADAIRLIREVADALGKAHAAGVVHRDIKPENILLADGHALVADFGVAKALTAAATPAGGGLTTAGMSLGTPGYMAPEQVAADPAADHRTDIYSLGIVAWEVLVGKAPFAHLPPAQQLAAQVTTVPEPLSAKRPDCPPALADTIARCLAKVPGERPQNAAQLKAMLDGASGAHTAGVAGSRIFGVAGRRSPAALSGTLAVVAVAFVIVVGGMLLALQWTHRRSKADVSPSLAVLPFENLQGDSAMAWFSDGIAEEIIGAVSRVPGLQVASRSVSFRHRGANVDVQRVGRELGVTHLLEGSVQRAGQRVRVNVRLTNVASGFSAWSERYDRELTDIFTVEDEIAAAVASALDVQLGTEGSRRIASAGATTNTEAHDQYLLGLKARNERNIRMASERFTRAIALDSGYAAAHAALASVLVLYPEYGLTTKPDSAMTAARAAAGRALALDSTQAAAHLALAYAAKVHGRDFAGAEREYRYALALDDNDAQAHHWHGELLMELRKFAEARVEFGKSVRLDPTAPASLAMLAMVEFRTASGNSAATVDSAQAICRHVTEISPPGGVFPLEFACGSALTRVRRFEVARPYLVRAGRALGDSALFAVLMDGVRDASRRAAAVAAVDRQVVVGGKMEPVLGAVWYLLLSEPDRAVGALEQAAQRGSPFASFLEVLDFSALPDSPRMKAVRKKLGY